MRFVSLYAKFAYNVKGESMRWVRDSAGNERQVGNGDGIYVQFKPSALTADEHQAAIEIFTKRNPQHPFGATPKLHDDVINAQEALAEGEAHNAHDGFLPWQRLGMCDTDDRMQVRPQDREAVEEGLQNAPEFGIDLFRIDNYNLVPPWPSYPTAATASVASVIDYANKGGYDFRKILVYEKATTNRPGLVEALSLKVDEQLAAAEEAKALQVG